MKRDKAEETIPCCDCLLGVNWWILSRLAPFAGPRGDSATIGHTTVSFLIVRIALGYSLLKFNEALHRGSHSGKKPHGPRAQRNRGAEPGTRPMRNNTKACPSAQSPPRALRNRLGSNNFSAFFLKAFLICIARCPRSKQWERPWPETALPPPR